MVAHAFNPSTSEAEAGDLFEFEARLVYISTSRTAIATYRDPISNNNNNNQKKPNKIRAQPRECTLSYT